MLWKTVNIILKRCMDLIGSLCGLILLSPVFCVLAVMVKRDSEGPVFYRQTRVTCNFKEFKALKFRTMTVVDEDDGITSNDKKTNRVTQSGAFLRKYRLDELPQLWNVLTGEMSLVGPRPQIPKYMPFYPEIYKEVLSVRPGITGLASIKFHEREERMLEEAGVDAEEIYTYKILPRKFHYNLFYVRKNTIFFDLKIMWWTVKGMLGKK